MSFGALTATQCFAVASYYEFDYSIPAAHDLTGDGLCGSCLINFVTDGIEDAGPPRFGCSGAHKSS